MSTILTKTIATSKYKKKVQTVKYFSSEGDKRAEYTRKNNPLTATSGRRI